LRILELDLKAFGPFTEKRLDLGDGRPGLCVIHGANEAGKSSALRAIHDLLYGIPARSPDDFLHRYADLRIGARLRFADGQTLGFIRRKRNKDTVQGYEGDADPPLERLDELQQAVPESVFRHFYGLDHERLSRGSQALLDDDGELGRTLYAAGLGTGNLRALLAELKSEAEALFTPRGRQRSINARLAELRQVQARIKQESLRPRAWEEAKEAEQRARARLSALEASHGEQRARLARLRRVQRTLPGLARRRHWLARQAALPRLPELGMDFETRLSTLRSRRQAASEAQEAARTRRSRLEERLAELPVAPGLLAEESAIRALQARWGAVARELEDLPRREGELERLERETSARWAAIDPTGSLRASDRLPELLGRGRRLRELAQAVRALEEGASQDQQAWRAACERLEAIERAWAEEQAEEADAAPLHAQALRRAIQAAESLGDIDGRIAERGRLLASQDAARAQGHASLGEALPPPDRLEHALIPEAEVLERAAATRSELDRRAERLEEARQERGREQREIDEELARVRGERAVPSEAELEARRREREALWRRVRRAWESGASPDDSHRTTPLEGADAMSLPDAYQASVGRSDETADRLRADADRVARVATLTARHARLEEEERSAAEEWTRLDGDRKAHEQEWRSLWSVIGIVPGSPLQMIAWRRRFERWLDLARQRRATREAGLHEIGIRREAEAALRQVLTALPDALRSRSFRDLERPDGLDPGDGAGGEAGSGAEAAGSGSRLAPLLSFARSVHDRIEATALRRARLGESRALAGREQADAERRMRLSAQRLEDWRLEWADAVEGLGFERIPRTAEALDRLELLREIVEIARDRDGMADRVAKMRSDIERFDADLKALLDRVAPQLDASGSTRAQQVHRLQEALEGARTAEARRADLVEELVETTDRLEAAEGTLRAAAEALETLRAEAGVGEESELDPILKAWAERAEIRRELAGLERSLIETGDGRTIEALVAEAEGEDPDVLRGRIEDLETGIEAQAEEVEATRETIARARATLQTMDGGGAMAALAAAAESERATIRREVERYAVLRLAHAILEREVERYRREHQAPVLTRARRIFEHLTRGAWPQLEVDYDEKGRAELVGVRREALGPGPTRRVRIEAMSAGTRDQLFLALRLATLEDALERAEPMPLVADDILVHFDDARAQAGLEVLADLGQRTQILLFTHHTRVRDQARTLGERARVLELGDDASGAA